MILKVPNESIEEALGDAKYPKLEGLYPFEARRSLNTAHSLEISLFPLMS
ncbi:MAG: hypothetical protein H6Q54_437 [Deltaproteobacteria bacterium]|jgi:hypothetical protein|nr:hypothetical protein [Deltaproteobacteria bacterium]